MALTDQEPQKSAKKAEHVRGRKKGCEKTGGSGYYAPPPGLKGAALRSWLLEKSSALESLVRLSCGKPIRLHGPTGKVVWHYPDAAQVMWAVERILKKALPDLAGITLSGDADAPVVTQHLDTPLGHDKELARRLALLQRVIDAPEESQDAPADDRPLGKGNGGNGAQRVLEAPAESSNGQCSPAVGEATVVDKARGISLVRLSDDERPDHGGDWEVQLQGERVKVLRGIALDGARAVVEAMDAEERFDD